MSETKHERTTLYQNEVAAPTLHKRRLIPVQITATCGVCGKGTLQAYMDGGCAWLHSCSNCDVTQWHNQKFPRLEYEAAPELGKSDKQ